MVVGNREFPNIFIERRPICYREVDNLWTSYWKTGVMDFGVCVASA